MTDQADLRRQAITNCGPTNQGAGAYCSEGEVQNTTPVLGFERGSVLGEQPSTSLRARSRTPPPVLYARNHLGSIIEALSPQGQVLDTVAYSPYGRIVSPPGTLAPSFGYAGMFQDPTTGLSLTQYRAYDPNLRRWLFRDPLGRAGGGVNLYGYVGDNPISYTDPLGLWGFGGIGSASAEAGLTWFGGGATVSAGGGLFWGGSQGVNLGGFASAGGFLGGPDYGPSYPAQQPSSCNQPNTATGAFAGAGGGVFLTNADSVAQLAGPFTNYNYNIEFGPLQFTLQIGVNGSTWIGSLTFGPGIGASGSSYQTNTWATR